MDDLIYFDNAATSFPKPEIVYEFMDTFYRRAGVSPGRSGYDIGLEAGQLLEETRCLLTRYFNGNSPERLVFSANSTDALNLAISGMVKPGGHVITTTLEHNAVLRPLYHLSRYNGVDVDYIPFDGNGFVNPEDFKSRFRSDTCLVVVNHASNVIGTIQPLKEIGRLCRQYEVPFLVDASQTAGKIPIDVQDLNIDVVAFTGHKSLMGPTGVGGLYVRNPVIIRHSRAGGTGVKSAARHHLEEYPYRLEYGTLNILGIAGLNAGFKWLLERSMHSVHQHETHLISRLAQALGQIDRVTTYCANRLEDHIGVLSFNVNGFEAASTGTLLDGEYNIACRTGLHCAPLVHECLKTDKIHGTVRVGVGPFNTAAQVDQMVKAVREIASLYGKP
ncbi:MAG: aminotransferase class V-fold PLP-dependent enzyme [Desulfobacteraceae bacterium]|nr:MAG: aminotransferase class V-fold PLP-dependent enzyme [Desulfobacteraceae bacterium]